MRVAHLDTGRTWRGGQGQVLLLLRELRRRGHTQVLLAPPGPLADRARTEGVEVHAWRVRSELDPFAVARARAVLRRFAPDVAHAHSARAHALGVPAARLAGVPGVVVSRRVDFRVGGHLLSRLKYRMEVDRYLCISHGVERAMLDSGVPAAKLALVPSGIDLAEVRAAGAREVPDLRATLGLPAGAPLVGTVASLAPHKNHALLLEAAARVARARDDAHFVWLGDGECRADLLRQRAELGLERRVHLLGFVDDARARMTQFTVFALSSYLEGLCTSLLDAQALGVPIVATAVGGVPEVVADGRSGRLVATLDPDAYAAALLEALADPGARAEWVRGGLAHVEGFSSARTAELTEQVYTRVLAERGAPA